MFICLLVIVVAAAVAAALVVIAVAMGKIDEIDKYDNPNVKR